MYGGLGNSKQSGLLSPLLTLFNPKLLVSKLEMESGGLRPESDFVTW